MPKQTPDLPLPSIQLDACVATTLPEGGAALSKGHRLDSQRWGKLSVMPPMPMLKNEEMGILITYLQGRK